MPNKVIILGAGGHGRVIADIIISAGNQVLGFLDDHVSGETSGFSVLGKLSDAFTYIKSYSFVIGIGSNQLRKQLAEAEIYNVDWYTAIHPTAVIARDVFIGEGTVVMAGAIINSGARIGKHCIINTGAIIEHDNRIADFVHISPNATLSGAVSVGELTHIGAGATVRNNITITHDCVIGAGAVVIKDIIKSGTYVGVPVKKIR